MKTEWTADEQRAHRDLWCAALESGEFPHGRGQLRSPRTGHYSVLGMACEIFRRQTGLGQWYDEYRPGGIGSFGLSRRDEKATVLPDIVRRYFGLRHADGGYGPLHDRPPASASLLPPKQDPWQSLLRLDNIDKLFLGDIALVIWGEPEGLIDNGEHSSSEGG